MIKIKSYAINSITKKGKIYMSINSTLVIIREY